MTKAQIINWRISDNNLENLCAKIKTLDLSIGYTANITPTTEKRSDIQNNRLWLLYAQLGLHIGETADQVHALCGYQFLRYQKEVAGQNIELIKSTTKLTTAEMADFQSNIERWAAGIGFYFQDS